jgi:hypothetical protein
VPQSGGEWLVDRNSSTLDAERLEGAVRVPVGGNVADISVLPLTIGGVLLAGHPLMHASNCPAWRNLFSEAGVA